ncbi:MAG: methionine--tRNA ligase subunit beta [Candidatus Liptonbacteria bacterium]|nr:methionine--tRNA ligase subunit beta [Candidatus Liptonbacteria bacterium]
MTIDEFRQVELKIAKIIKAERVPESEKLMVLHINIGQEERQIVAGIGKTYLPEDLVGKEIVIVANLNPRKLMGLTSQGMLLAAHDTEGVPILIVPEKEVEPGSNIS